MEAESMKPQKVMDVEIAFPANVLHLMPKWEEIPETYKNGSKTNARNLFYKGGKISWEAREGIDSVVALRHLKCIMGSFQPKHEHKMAAVDYLIDLWFSKFEVAVAG